MGEIIKLTGLWESKTKNGLTLLRGSLNAITSILIMPNSLKNNDKDPDFYLYFKAREKDGAAKPAAEPRADKDELNF